jgi:mycothiol synthase
VDNGSTVGKIGATHGRVTVEPFDISTASAADVAACHAAKVAAIALDRPDQPVQSLSDFRDWLTAQHEDNRVVVRLVRDGGGAVGLCYLLLPLKENRGTGFLYGWVHPDHRGRGAGTELLADALTTVRGDGRQLLITETIEGTAGSAFMTHRGFRPAQREVLSRLDLSTVDRSRLAAVVATDHQPYRLEHWRGPVPEQWVDRYARALSNMNDAPLGDLEYENPDYTRDYVRKQEAWAEQRGREQRITVAIHEPSGEIAGLTLVLVPVDPDGRAYQDDTTVVRAHRGSGLGIWMKADMALRLIAEHPEVKDVLTGNADDNAHMRRINIALGFVVAQVNEEQQASVDDVAKLLGV